MISFGITRLIFGSYGPRGDNHKDSADTDGVNL